VIREDVEGNGLDVLYRNFSGYTKKIDRKQCG
jgi:hypothetical protein